MSWVQWGAAQTPGQPWIIPEYSAESPQGIQPFGGREHGEGRADRLNLTPQNIVDSGSTDRAVQYGRAGLVASGLTGIPGLSLVGAGIGTGQDVRSFGGRYNAPTFEGSAREHFTSAVTGGLFGSTLPEQAIARSPGINPAYNPADVYSGTTIGLRSLPELGVSSVGKGRERYKERGERVAREARGRQRQGSFGGAVGGRRD